MIAEYIAYTASMVSYLSQATGKSIREVAIALGMDGVDKIARNAAMLRHLPTDRMARELESDFWETLGLASNSRAHFDEAYGRAVAEKIKETTEDSHQYVAALYAALTAEA